MTEQEKLFTEYNEEYKDEEYKIEQAQQPDLKDALESLKANTGNTPDSTVLYGLSGLMPNEIEQLKPVWGQLPALLRRNTMREMVRASEANFEMDYRAVGIFGLKDEDPAVREAAIEVLWEDESLEVMNRLVALSTGDEVASVREAATIALGRYILKGELGDLPEDEVKPARDAVIQLLQSDREEIDVRRRALESIANCGHEIVPGAIREAYNNGDQRMRVSAIYAMGRSCDPKWEDIVMREIESDDPELRYEAAKAAGELELLDAVPHLARLVMEEDREIQEVAIWSLGEIGGREVMRILDLLAEKAEEDEDEALIDAVEEAIGNASLAGDDIGLFDLD